MIAHMKLRARALQQQHRALFAAVFLFRSAVSVLLVCAAVAGILFLPKGRSIALAAFCIFLFVFFRAIFSLGEALCFVALAKGRPANFRLFLSAFRGKNLLRACASLLLSGAVWRLFATLLCIPAGMSAVLLLRLLQRGMPGHAALLFLLGTAAAIAATVPALLHFGALFLPRALYLAEGCTARQSVLHCLRIPEEDRRLFLRLQRSFLGWWMLCVLVVPLPFVWGYFAQSRALAFSVMNLRRIA